MPKNTATVAISRRNLTHISEVVRGQTRRLESAMDRCNEAHTLASMDLVQKALDDLAEFVEGEAEA